MRRITDEDLDILVSAINNCTYTIDIPESYALELKDACELIKEMRGRLIESRIELEEYELTRTGEAYNNPYLNLAIDKAREYCQTKEA